MSRFILIPGLLLIACSANAIHWETITFEDYAPSKSFTSIPAGEPYGLDGTMFFLESAIGQSAVFDSEWNNNTMIGNDSDWLGFSPIDTITLRTFGSAFFLDSLLIGPTTRSDSSVDMTITGNFWGGGTETMVFENLLDATMVELNWEDLLSVEFGVSSVSRGVDAAIDDLRVKRLPAPTTLALLIPGLLGLGWLRHKKVTP